jgi:hypothetical protein
MPLEEVARIRVPTPHVERAAEHDAVVAGELGHLARRRHRQLEVMSRKVRGDRLGDLLRGALLRRVRDEHRL